MSGSGAEIAALGLGIGLMFSLVCYLLTNLSPGGMITPGWLALAMVATPERVIIIAIVTAVTAGLTLVLRKYVILYGKRLFASVVMVGIFVQMTIVVLLANVIPSLTSGETIGFIIPGLMAYQLVRQPTGATLLAIGAVASMAYGVIITGVLLGLVEESSQGFTSGISDGPLGLGGWGLLIVLGVIVTLTGGLVFNLGRIREKAAAPPPVAPRRGEDPVLLAAGAAAAASQGHAGPAPPVGPVEDQPGDDEPVVPGGDAPVAPVAPIVAHAEREPSAEPRAVAPDAVPLFGQQPTPPPDPETAPAPAPGTAPESAPDGETGPEPEAEPSAAAPPKAPPSPWVDDPAALEAMAAPRPTVGDGDQTDDLAPGPEVPAEPEPTPGDVGEGHRVVLEEDGLVVAAPVFDDPRGPAEPHVFVVRARLSAYAAEFLPAAEADRLAAEVGALPGTQAEKFAIVIEHVQRRRQPTALRNAGALVRHGALSIEDASAMTGASVEDIQRHLLGGL